jgi:hypothetical protein
MRFFKRSRRKRDNEEIKEFSRIYGWASPYVPRYKRCPYVYVWKIIPQPNGNAIPAGFSQGGRTRRFIHKNLLWEASSNPQSPLNQALLDRWNQILPSASRLPTHLVEMGILRKGSGIPRSPFFIEYFCFTPYNGKDSNKVAIRIAGFLSDRVEELGNYDGEALDDSRAYWLAAVLCAWSKFGF